MRHLKRYLSILLIISLMISSSSFSFGEVTYRGDKESTIIPSSEVSESMDISAMNDVVFLQNKTQHDKSVDYYVNTSSGTYFYEKNGTMTSILPLDFDTSKYEEEDGPKLWAFKENFINQNNISIKPEKVTQTKYNYIIGNDKKNHVKNISGYKTLSYGEIYKNVLLDLNVNEQTIEKVFTVQPSGAVDEIKIQVDGVNELSINNENELVFNTDDGITRLSAPFAYQIIDSNIVEVEVDYTVENNVYGFVVGDYNKDIDLIIDPAYICSYFGQGKTYTYVEDVTTDIDGNIYLTGSAYSAAFPTTAGVYQSDKKGSYDMFVSKLDPGFTTLSASTFIGGDGTGKEYGQSIVVTDTNRVYVSGYSNTLDFPTLANSYDDSITGQSGVVFEMSSDLVNLVSSTIIDGSRDAGSLAIESDGDVVVAGTAVYTGVGPSNSVETTSGVYGEALASTQTDVYIMRFNENLSALKTSTLLGGSSAELFSSMFVSKNDDIVITGSTYNNGFPTTVDAYSPTSSGSYDGFVSILSNDLTTLKASTFYGTSALDYVGSVAEDYYGNIYVVGSGGNDVGTDASSYQQTNGGGNDAFVLKFNRFLTTLNASTYLGGTGGESGKDIEISKSGEVIVVGQTNSSNFTLTPNAYDTTYQSSEGYVVKLNSDLSDVNYSTFIGGHYKDVSKDIYIDDRDEIYITGETSSMYLPVTDGVFETSSSYASKISFFFKIPQDMTGLGAADYVKNVSVEQANAISFGAYEQSKSLLSVAGALDISFDISYNSILLDDSSVGLGWKHSASKSLYELNDGFATIESNTGMKQKFVNSDGNYIPEGENYQYDELKYNSTTGHHELTKDQQVYAEFDNGNLVKEKLKTGESVSYEYTNNLLEKIIEDKSGNYIDIVYVTGTDKIDKILDNMNREVSFTYDANDCLETITYADGVVSTFTYNNDNQLLSEVISNATEQYTLFSNTYDSLGRLITVDDNNANNLPISFEYDEETIENHVIVKRTNQDGKLSQTVYDYNYNIVSQTDELNKTFNYFYTKGVLVCTEDAVGNETRYTFTDKGLLETIENSLNEVITYTYDVNHNLKTVVNNITGTKTYDYDANNRLIEIKEQVTIENPDDYSGGSYGTNPQFAITTIAYSGDDLDYIIGSDGYTLDYTINLDGQIEKVESKDNVTQQNSTASKYVSYLYDDVGRLVEVKDSLNHSYKAEYYLNDQIKKITNPLLQTQTYEYYVHGGVKSVSDYENEVTSYKYDHNLNLSEVADPIVESPVDQVQKFYYDKMNRLLSSTDRNGNSVLYEYFDNGWLSKQTDDEGVYFRNEYYDNGQVKATYQLDTDNSPAEKKIVEYTYNGLNNVATSTDALNNTTYYNYDNLGRLLNVQDAEVNTTQFAYDELNRLIKSTNADLDVAKQVFSKEGRILYIQDTNDDFTNPNSYLHKYEYDAYGRLETVKDSGITKSSLTYQANSDLVESSQNGRAQSTTYTYDELNRVESITDTVNVREYTYDETNNKVTVTTKELGTLVTLSTLEYEYDANGQITQYTDENGNVINYSYYPNGELHTLTYPGNKVVSYTYNNANQLETVTDWNNDVTTYAYDANGKLSSMTRPNGTVESYTYYKNDWLKSKTDKDSSNNIISEYNFAFDNVGNIVTENGNNNNITNVYSDLYELEQQVKKDDSQTLLHQYTYTYDDEGNILTRSDENGVVDTMTYVDGNKLATYNGASVIYDNDGNMTSGPIKGVNTTYTFDSRNQLNSVGDHTYKYDAQGRRIEVDINGDTTEFVVNPLAGYNQILIKTAPSGVSTYYVYGIGLISEETSSNQKFYHFDNRGSTIALTSSNETITDVFEYGPYGELLSRTGTSDILFRFNGKVGVVTDQNNLVFMMTRYYNSNIRRFVNQDVVLGSLSPSLSLNQYAYTQGNPINYIDPWGTDRGELDYIIKGSESKENNWGLLSEYELRYDGKPIIDAYLTGVTIAIGFTIADVAYDGICLIAGKDIITGQETSRLLLAGAVFAPQILESGMKTGIKYGDDVFGLVDDIAEGTSETVARKTDFYVNPKGDAIPANRQMFDENLSNMVEQNGKYIGDGSNGPVRVRVEDGHLSNPDFSGPIGIDHEIPHVHVEYRKNVLTGPWGKGDPINKTTFPQDWLK